MMAAILIGAVITLPFGLMLITSTPAAQSVIIVATIILAALALQANTHHAALQLIEASIKPHPTSEVRNRLLFDASLLAISSIVVSLLALLLLHANIIPSRPWTGTMTWTQACILSLIGSAIVLINFRSLTYLLLALAPLLLPILAYSGQIDLLTVALWQSLTSIILVITTIEFQLRSFISHSARFLD